MAGIQETEHEESNTPGWLVRKLRQQWVGRLAQADQCWSDADTLQAAQKVLTQACELPIYQNGLGTKLMKQSLRVKSLSELTVLLPIFDKKKMFKGRSLDGILPAQRIRQTGLIYTSSGYSGEFAWGFEPRKSGCETVSELDVMLDWLFEIAGKPTLLINALPTGVRIEAGLPAVIETGPRSDSVTAALRVARPSFGQTILVGDWPLLKAALEQAVREKALGRKGGPVHLITGGDWIAENWRSYVTGLLEKACPGLAGTCMINFGVSELGLSVGLETDGCRMIRQAAHEEGELRQKLFGDVPAVPTLVQYQPWRYWVETPVVGGCHRLVVTTLEQNRLLPLIRYCTGDLAQVWSYAQWRELVEHAGRPDLLPKERIAKCWRSLDGGQ
ncbi:MAG: hypothetical protein HC898_04400 [Phycisphaerales bacterium]|nr:hypothetical protein [Phycisphaerales bacterium]